MRTNIHNTICAILMAGTVFIGGVGDFGSKDASAGTILVSDFDDGTFQGWTPEPIFNGVLFQDPSGGNPGGFMVAIDTVSGGGSLLVRAPPLLSGNLSSFAGLQWEDFVYDTGAPIDFSTSIVLRGTDGTEYQSDQSIIAVDAWTPRFVAFDDPGAWFLRSGTGTYEDVIQNVSALFISMDVARGINVRESGVDNVTLVTKDVSELGTLAIFGLGLAGVGAMRRRKRNRTNARSPFTVTGATLFLMLTGLFVTTQASAGTVTVDFNSLPSDQGWTYNSLGNTLLETDIFSVDGTTLHMDTISPGGGLISGVNL